MATETYYLIDTKVSGINHLDVQTSVPTATDSTTSWNMDGGSIAGEYSEAYANVQRAESTFDTPAVPTTIDTTNGNGWRLTGAKDGSYASGNWSFGFRLKVLSGTNNTGDVGIAFLLWKSSNADGSSGSAIGTLQQTTYTTNLTSSGATVTATYDPGGITLTSEYLFLLVALRVNPAGNASTDVIGFRSTSTNAVTTTDFTAATTGHPATKRFGGVPGMGARSYLFGPRLW